MLSGKYSNSRIVLNFVLAIDGLSIFSTITTDFGGIQDVQSIVEYAIFSYYCCYLVVLSLFNIA